MAFKFVVFLASLAVASAGYLEAPAVSYAAPVAHYSPASSVSYSSLSHATPLAYAAPVAKTVAYSSPAVGATHESTIRGHDATISHQSKAIDTAFSSVRKSDTRITNEAPKLAYASYAAPAVHTSYAAPAVATYAHAAPAVATYAAPVAVAKQVSYAAPAYQTYAHAAPAVATYAHAAPVVAAHATKTLTYSPAVEVAHVSYDGTHAHYGW
ncbi:AAEL000896-PA [Aedes aegypti]|uniref:AAEL000896-PA n=2 Tax=Aedes aegypti TaxID=7159 RepID=A0A1S4EX67_AEDAE|nr:larval/pupal cuticle protein H1C [Aedes aegypti]EAT48063.1 AAEL000896-PA [Aedes aegypti]